MKTLNESTTLIASIKFIATGNIPSQVESIGEPIYKNGKVVLFEINHQSYNYEEECMLDFSIENFSMSSSVLSDCTFRFSNYFTFNVVEKGRAEFELCVLIENVSDNLLKTIDELFTPVNITVNNFTFKDEAYFIESDMSVVEILECTVDDIC